MACNVKNVNYLNTVNKKYQIDKKLTKMRTKLNKHNENGIKCIF